jgi:hypothetical protein
VEEETPREPRKSRARERQVRRRERQSHVTPAGTGSRASRPRQIDPIDQRSFKLPKFNVPQSANALYVIGGFLFLVGIIVVLGLLKNDAPRVDPNALWVGTEWTYENRSADELTAFAQRLRDNRIGTLYTWVSYLKADREWSGKRDGTNEFSEVQPSVKAFVENFKLIYPDVHLYGWVSVPTDTLGIPARLGEEEVQTAIADFSGVLVNELGFDGVFLNIETVWDGDQEFLDVLRKVRATLGTSVPVSVAVPPDWSPTDADIPTPPLIVPGTEWAKEYKQSVAILADQIVVMGYNSGLSRPDDYSRWLAYQVKAFAEAVGELDTGDGTTQLVIGIPSYASELPGHDTNAENIPTALRGVQTGLNQAEDFSRFVQGVAIYAEWETDETEWEQFKETWIDGS